ncbi:arsenate reductase ArsC [uncultured Clostridium sp.]|uniref:arsenate reductase ArsC n=1 Tax=uncultured Clostridium sp. TaxID=59620 RepID=UPI003216BF34
MKLRVAFICTGNSCRSQMAEGFAKKYGSDVLEIYSAGTIPVEKVNPTAVEVMKEIGVDLGEHFPKTLKDIPEKIDIAITMGCIKGCPVIDTILEEDWGLDDPVGKPLDEFRKVRDIIEEKIKNLVKRVKIGELK